MMTFPQIDPVALHIGSFGIRWYALAYIAGILAGWAVFKKLLAGPFAHTNIPPVRVDEFSNWAVLGIVLGGRIGYCLFYNPVYYLGHPLEILALWEGGMSFHGGAAGVIIALFAFSAVNKINALSFGDALVCVVPFGLFFGRLANFINGELVGRVTTPDMPFAMIFPHIDALPRHPSQLYEAFGEGLLLFAVLILCALKTRLPRYPGAIGGLFLAGYGVIRFAIEFTREPDVQLGFLAGGMSMGQLLCIPMLVCGLGLTLWARFRTK